MIFVRRHLPAKAPYWVQSTYRVLLCCAWVAAGNVQDGPVGQVVEEGIECARLACQHRLNFPYIPVLDLLHLRRHYVHSVSERQRVVGIQVDFGEVDRVHSG